MYGIDLVLKKKEDTKGFFEETLNVALINLKKTVRKKSKYNSIQSWRKGFPCYVVAKNLAT